MTKEELINYIMKTPENVNQNVLITLLDTLMETDNLDTSDANATAGDMLNGKTAYVNGKKITGTIASKEAETITPSTTDKEVAAGQYLNGKITVKGDSNLLAENIKAGVTIFGVTGTFTNDAEAAAGDIRTGKSAYVKGQKIEGSAIIS